MKSTDDLWRYHRQMLLGGVREAGQGRLSGSRVVVVGCGALGCLSAEWLVRAGVGEVVVIDRDVVEVTNLQRQVLFDEADAAEGLPKAEAARRRLGAINGSVRVEGVVADVTAGNVERLLGLVGEGRGVDVIVDGLDNFETRYLLNDVAMKHGVAYLYGGAVGMTGAVYPVLPRTRGEDRAWEVAGVAGPDLEAIFPELPPPGSTATCDTAGVLGPVVGVVASVQAAETIKILTGQWGSVMRTMLHVDLSTNRFRQVDVAALEEGVDGRGGRYRFLEGQGESGAVVLCGRHAVQVSPAREGVRLDLEACAQRLREHGRAEATTFVVRAVLKEGDREYELTVFADGRALIKGTEQTGVARALYARYLGG